MTASHLAPLLILLFLLCCALISPARAGGSVALHAPKDAASLPILHDGRIKPLDSFARIHKKLFSGQESGAMDWLLQTLFDPGAALTNPVFRVKDAEVQTLLNLPARKPPLYSFAELSPALDQQAQTIEALLKQQPGQVTKAQQALIDLHIHKILFSQILRSMSLITPLSVTPPQMLQDRPLKGSYSALDLKRYDQPARAALKAVMAAKGDDLSRYTEQEMEVLHFVFTLDMLQETGIRSVLLRVIPQQQGAAAEWLSPSSLIETGQGSPRTKSLLSLWAQTAKAYRGGDQAALNAAFSALREETLSLAGINGLAARLWAENIYKTLQPFHAALILLLLGGFFSLLHAAAIGKGVHRFALPVSALGMLALLGGIALRIFILQRPPVATLYESALFVSLIVMIFGIVMERRAANGIALTGSSIVSAALIALSGYVSVNPDDKEVLVAVLNTNFWLAVHVLCITAGYGACLMAGTMAHAALWCMAVKDTRSKKVMDAAAFTALIALLLTAVGTILGGIWADQSWGRFWGWDPKENGALLIVLWLIWVIHGRLSGHLRDREYAAFLAAVNIIVALAWFGVNLLNVGLHSYGFISGIATGLGIFCGGEVILITLLYGTAKRKGAAHAA